MTYWVYWILESDIRIEEQAKNLIYISYKIDPRKQYVNQTIDPWHKTSVKHIVYLILATIYESSKVDLNALITNGMRSVYDHIYEKFIFQTYTAIIINNI